jgi:hypothetical protein
MTPLETYSLSPGTVVADEDDIMIVLEWSEEKYQYLLKQITDYHSWESGSFHWYRPESLEYYTILTEEEKARLL